MKNKLKLAIIGVLAISTISGLLIFANHKKDNNLASQNNNIPKETENEIFSVTQEMRERYLLWTILLHKRMQLIC